MRCFYASKFTIEDLFNFFKNDSITVIFKTLFEFRIYSFFDYNVFLGYFVDITASITYLRLKIILF